MDPTRPDPPRAARALALVAASAVTAAAPSGGADELAGRLEVSLRRDRLGQLTFTHRTDPGTYYRLRRGADPGAIDEVLAISLGRDLSLLRRLRDTSPPPGKAFYQVDEIPLGIPRDSDGDGLDDVFELTNPHYFDPRDPSDALPLEDGANQILDRATYELLARRDNVPGASGLREVKVLVVDIDTDHPLVYFFNTVNHPFHYRFTQDVLDLEISHGTFNAQTYFTNTNRRFIAGSFLAHDTFVDGEGEAGIYTLEFWPTDPVAFPFVELAYRLVTAAAPFAQGKVRYHPAGETHRALFAAERASYEASDILTVSTEELFGNLTFSPLNHGAAFGRLRVITPGATETARDIAIFPVLPNDLGHVAGIITEVQQTPLSHVNLKAQQNNTPNAFIRDASADPRIAPLLGQNVRYEVTADGFTLREATQEEVDAYLDSVRPEVGPVPVRDLGVTEITPLSDIGFDDAGAFGVKAANLAELRGLLPDGTVPDGFAVPFHFYHTYMEHNGFYDAAREMIEDPPFSGNADYRRFALGSFRDRIREGELPPGMAEALDALHQSFPEGQPLRCRSSTNNEDLEGFNGAGLYNSYTHRPDEGHLGKTMRQVWASLWTYRAYEERDFYRIDHFLVAMGVLVHPNFDDEKVNGVAITTNIYDPSWRGYYVNAQVGEALVTNPGAGEIPEEFLVADLLGAEEFEIQYVRFSNQVEPGERVLTPEQIFLLADHMELIQNHFKSLYRAWADPLFAMDIEFKVDADDQLVIKQARPWVH